MSFRLPFLCFLSMFRQPGSTAGFGGEIAARGFAERAPQAPERRCDQSQASGATLFPSCASGDFDRGAIAPKASWARWAPFIDAIGGEDPLVIAAFVAYLSKEPSRAITMGRGGGHLERRPILGPQVDIETVPGKIQSGAQGVIGPPLMFVPERSHVLTGGGFLHGTQDLAGVRSAHKEHERR